MTDIILWAITMIVFLGPPIFIILKAELIYNFIFKFWSKIVDEETKVMIVENKKAFIIFTRVLGGVCIVMFAIRFAITFMY